MGAALVTQQRADWPVLEQLVAVVANHPRLGGLGNGELDLFLSRDALGDQQNADASVAERRPDLIAAGDGLASGT